MAKRKKQIDTMARTGIPLIKGEEYPFGEKGKKPSSFSEIFDGDIFDDKALLNEAARRAEEKRQQRSTPQSYPPPQETLDLHGCTAQEAEDKTRHFIEDARHRGIRTLRVITGKGLHSPGGLAVLPDIIEQKLTLLKKEGGIVAFSWERKVKSKSGALHVYL
ncbi:MAG: Smr/MutS family protein [Thermodesulfobacteriota bacterium]